MSFVHKRVAHDMGCANNHSKRRHRRDSEINAALKACEGKVSEAALLLGISRQALYRRLDDNPHLGPRRIRYYPRTTREEFSDEECEELIALTGQENLARYRWMRRTFGAGGTVPVHEEPVTEEQRLWEIFDAVCVTFDILRTEDGRKKICELRKLKLALRKQQATELRRQREEKEITRRKRALWRKRRARKTLPPSPPRGEGKNSGC